MQSKIIPSPPKYLQEEETVSQQCKELISTLPKEQGWLASHLYNYQGFWYPVRHLQGVVSCQSHFLPHDSDILLVTTPKSGTTWLKALVFALVHRASHAIAENHPLLTVNPHDAVPFLEIKLYADIQVPDFSRFTVPRVFATHLPYSSLPEPVQAGCRCKIVYLCRNPKDIFVSLWQFTNSLRGLEAQPKSVQEALDMFCRGVSLFGPVWDHVAQYWKLSRETPDRIMFLRFEEIKDQPREQLRCLAEFLGCPFSRPEEESGLAEEIVKMCSFDHLSGLEVNRVGKLESGEENRTFFRRGVVGDWKNYLGPEMAERIDRITEEKLSGLGLIL